MLLGIDDCSISSHDSTGCQAGLAHMFCPKDMHHALAFAYQVVGYDAAVAPPPDGFRAHDRGAVLDAKFSQACQACSERPREGIVRIVAKTAHAPIGVGGWLQPARLTSKSAKLGDMLIADLPQRQRFLKTFTIKLRICARARYRPHIDNKIDARLPKKIDEFNDCPGRVTYGEEAVRVGSNSILCVATSAHRRRSCFGYFQIKACIDFTGTEFEREH